MQTSTWSRSIAESWWEVSTPSGAPPQFPQPYHHHNWSHLLHILLHQSCPELAHCLQAMVQSASMTASHLPTSQPVLSLSLLPLEQMAVPPMVTFLAPWKKGGQEQGTIPITKSWSILELSQNLLVLHRTAHIFPTQKFVDLCRGWAACQVWKCT